MNKITGNFDSYWDRSQSKRDIKDFTESIPRLERSHVRRMMMRLAERAWEAATNSFRKRHNMVLAKRKENMLKIEKEPGLEVWNTFGKVKPGEVFVLDGCSYMRLKYDAHRFQTPPKGYGWAIGLRNEGYVDAIKYSTSVTLCDVKMYISHK